MRLNEKKVTFIGELHVAVNFFIWFSFVLNSLAYITISRNNGKIKINYSIHKIEIY